MKSIIFALGCLVAAKAVKLTKYTDESGQPLTGTALTDRVTHMAEKLTNRVFERADGNQDNYITKADYKANILDKMPAGHSWIPKLESIGYEAGNKAGITREEYQASAVKYHLNEYRKWRSTFKKDETKTKDKPSPVQMPVTITLDGKTYSGQVALE